jgi:hypothetical protein
VRTLAGRAVVCSARPGRWRAGCLPQPPPDPAVAGGLRPSWSRSAPAGGALTAAPHEPPTRRRGPMRSPTPRGSWPRGPAGCRSTTSPLNGLSFCGGTPGFPLSAPAAGRVARSAWSDSGASDVRPGGGACGPLRAALKTYRNFAQHRRLPRVLRRLMFDTAASDEALHDRDNCATRGRRGRSAVESCGHVGQAGQEIVAHEVRSLPLVCISQPSRG